MKKIDNDEETWLYFLFDGKLEDICTVIDIVQSLDYVPPNSSEESTTEENTE